MKTKATLPPQTVPDIQNTKPEVFILESLSSKDENAKRFEGRVLEEMLRLAGKNPKYYYFQSKEELTHLAGLYRQSQYRYLHISSHASDSTIGLTNDTLTYEEFSAYFSGHLKLRRLFFSACQAGNRRFIDAIKTNNKGMHSLVAPAEDIQFDHAAALWSAFYVSMFTTSENSMKHSHIKDKLQSLAGLFPVDFYFASYFAKSDSWKEQTITKT